MNALTESEFNELLLGGLVTPDHGAPETFRLTESALGELETDRPPNQEIEKEQAFTSVDSRTHAPRWHLSERFSSGGGRARVLEVESEDELGEPEGFHELRRFQNVGLNYGYQGNEISLCETREPYRDVLKALVYDIFIGDGTYQFDCFHKLPSQAWTRIRIEFVPGVTAMPEPDIKHESPSHEGVFLLEQTRSSVVTDSVADDKHLTVAVREQYRKLGSLGAQKTTHFSFQLEATPDDFVLYLGTGRTLQKLDLERVGERDWEGSGFLNGLIVRAALSSSNLRDFVLVVTREAPGNSAN